MSSPSELALARLPGCLNGDFYATELKAKLQQQVQESKQKNGERNKQNGGSSLSLSCSRISNCMFCEGETNAREFLRQGMIRFASETNGPRPSLVRFRI